MTECELAGPSPLWTPSPSIPKQRSAPLTATIQATRTSETDLLFSKSTTKADRLGMPKSRAILKGGQSYAQHIGDGMRTYH